MTKVFSNLLVRLSLALAGAATVCADTVQTTDGAKLVGKVTKIDVGNIYLDTTYAGPLVIKQKEVFAIQTDGPIDIRLTSGSQLSGTVTTDAAGAVVITNGDGAITTTVAHVAAGWPTTGKDPELVALERHWIYEASVDIEGTTGNKDQLGTGASLSAKLVTPEDTLQYYGAYNRQETSGVKSADQFKAGIDFADNYTPRASWFLRDEGGYDRIMDITFYDTAAAGVGYDFIKTSQDILTGRVGLAYRYAGYGTAGVAAVNSAAGDFEIEHDLKKNTWELGNKLTVVPALNNLSDVIVTQDSFYQIPLLNPKWKLRLGVSNDYNGQPSPGFKRLDTTYYTRLILDWVN
jgi:hypothetical protein